MGILSGNPKDEPMHYGEVFGAWSYLNVAQAAVAGLQVMLNHTGDEDLYRLIEEAIQNSKQEAKQIEELLKENGVALPPAPPERAEACLEDIPAGARIQDPEVSASISKDLAAGLVACSHIIGQCTREDIAMMFGQFHNQKMALAGKFLRLNKEKGWLVVPPLHHHKKEC
ncbi:DUF3231 family protein [Bacillus sp. Marseille-P3661]|uniref:DUF3231 family protein n=1 Tax=Bacillus sp. Marseille-P3661 TaxID=1936234 RepID=UPI000C86720C|nr:DUF3231 family protein [Bacillus sp. Marseille-P3661]